jgi:hypothetical protein
MESIEGTPITIQIDWNKIIVDAKEQIRECLDCDKNCKDRFNVIRFLDSKK